MGEEGATLARAADQVADAYGASCAVLTSSGSAALEAVLPPLVGLPGSEVIVPDEACHRIAASVLRAGGRPRFVAVDRSLLLNPAGVIAAMTSRTVAVIVVHQYGLPAPIRSLRDAIPREVTIIEDVAQAW